MKTPSLPIYIQMSLSHWYNFNSLELLRPENAAKLVLNLQVWISFQKKKKKLILIAFKALQ